MKLEQRQIVKKIKNQLITVLLEDGEMSLDLYQRDLEPEVVDYFKESVAEDNEDCIFTIIVDAGQAAMLLVEKSGQVYSNEKAREKLKEAWQDKYTSNINQVAPMLAKQIYTRQLPIAGVKYVLSA